MSRGGAGRGQGRKKGVPNKKTQELIDILEASGYSPAAELIRIAAIAEKEYDRSSEIYDAIQEKRTLAGINSPLSDIAPTYLKIMQDSASDMMNYVYPKRKAVELTGENGKDLFGSFTDMAKRVLGEPRDE